MSSGLSGSAGPGPSARPSAGPRTDAGGGDALDLVFGALADPTRRHMLQTLLRDGSISVPALAGELPITRQAVAKHLAALDGAGLIERAPGRGREVRYRMRPRALAPAAVWLREADRAWEQRLSRLKDAVEAGG